MGWTLKVTVVYLVCYNIILSITGIFEECKKEHNILFHIGVKYVCGTNFFCVFMCLAGFQPMETLGIVFVLVTHFTILMF